MQQLLQQKLKQSTYATITTTEVETINLNTNFDTAVWLWHYKTSTYENYKEKG